MRRYIDAKALAYMAVCNGDADFINKVTKLMIEAPSIDIVHCGECIYRNNRKKCPMRVFTGDNDFCPCGKGVDDV